MYLYDKVTLCMLIARAAPERDREPIAGWVFKHRASFEQSMGNSRSVYKNVYVYICRTKILYQCTVVPCTTNL